MADVEVIDNSVVVKRRLSAMRTSLTTRQRSLIMSM